jgi:hypothetical protein
MAFVELDVAAGTSFYQLALIRGEWKIITGFRKANPAPSK